MRNWYQHTQSKIKELKLQQKYFRGSSGIHFLIKSKIIKQILSITDIQPDDHVLEIGPGLGILTEGLLNKTDHVTVIERNKKMAEHIHKEYGERVTVIHGDALHVNWPSDVKLVSNLPYSIGTDIVFLAIQNGIKSISVMLQEEVVDRFIAKPGSNNYSKLSVMSNFYGKAKKFFQIPPKAFYPEPKVNSSILQYTAMEVIPPYFRDFEELTTNIFSLRRRTVRKVLKGYLKKKVDPVVYDSAPFVNKRVFELAAVDIEKLYKYLQENDAWPLARER